MLCVSLGISKEGITSCKGRRKHNEMQFETGLLFTKIFIYNMANGYVSKGKWGWLLIGRRGASQREVQREWCCVAVVYFAGVVACLVGVITSPVSTGLKLVLRLN